MVVLGCPVPSIAIDVTVTGYGLRLNVIGLGVGDTTVSMPGTHSAFPPAIQSMIPAAAADKLFALADAYAKDMLPPASPGDPSDNEQLYPKLHVSCVSESKVGVVTYVVEQSFQLSCALKAWGEAISDIKAMAVTRSTSADSLAFLSTTFTVLVTKDSSVLPFGAARGRAQLSKEPVPGSMGPMLTVS